MPSSALRPEGSPPPEGPPLEGRSARREPVRDPPERGKPWGRPGRCTAPVPPRSRMPHARGLPPPSAWWTIWSFVLAHRHDGTDVVDHGPGARPDVSAPGPGARARHRVAPGVPARRSGVAGPRGALGGAVPRRGRRARRVRRCGRLLRHLGVRDRSSTRRPDGDSGCTDHGVLLHAPGAANTPCPGGDAGGRDPARSAPRADRRHLGDVADRSRRGAVPCQLLPVPDQRVGVLRASGRAEPAAAHVVALGRGAVLLRDPGIAAGRVAAGPAALVFVGPDPGAHGCAARLVLRAVRLAQREERHGVACERATVRVLLAVDSRMGVRRRARTGTGPRPLPHRSSVAPGARHGRLGHDRRRRPRLLRFDGVPRRRRVRASRGHRPGDPRRDPCRVRHRDADADPDVTAPHDLDGRPVLQLVSVALAPHRVRRRVLAGGRERAARRRSRGVPRSCVALVPLAGTAAPGGIHDAGAAHAGPDRVLHRRAAPCGRPRAADRVVHRPEGERQLPRRGRHRSHPARRARMQQRNAPRPAFARNLLVG